VLRTSVLILVFTACAAPLGEAPHRAQEVARGTLWEAGLQFVPSDVDLLKGWGDIEGWYDGSIEWAACKVLRGPTNYWLQWAIDRRQLPLPMDHDHIGYAKLALGTGLGAHAYLDCLRRANPTQFGAIRVLAETNTLIGGEVLDDTHAVPMIFAPHRDVVVLLDNRDDAAKRTWILEQMRQRRLSIAPPVWELLAETDLNAWSWQVEKGHKRFAPDLKADAWHPGETTQPRWPVFLSDRIESISTVHPERPTPALGEHRPVNLRYRFQSHADAELAALRFQQAFEAIEHVRHGKDETAKQIQAKSFSTHEIRVSRRDRDVRVKAPDDTETLNELLDLVLRSVIDHTTTVTDWEKIIRKTNGPRDYY